MGFLPEKQYIMFTELEFYNCGTPIVFASLMDQERQCFKSLIRLVAFV
ncbi:MAG: hypothetical protein ACI9WT_001296 [Flavobacterium sp.]|jgi:hypothetical protein